jgi:hypothetical protein
MDGLATTQLDGVAAALNFTAPMSEKPFSYNYDPPPGVPVRNTENETHTITVRDARAAGDALSLDREGFVLVNRKSAASNLYDEDIITKVYYPECERLMREATGAKRVVAFDHIVRNAARSGPGSTVKMPAGRVHNDYTAWSAPQRVRDLMGDEATCARRWCCAIPKPSTTTICCRPSCAIPTAAARPTRSPITRTSAGTISRKCSRTRRS